MLSQVRPNYGGVPVTVGVTMFILSIGDLSEKFMDFTFDMYFRQTWLDPRLTFEKAPDLDKLMVRGGFGSNSTFMLIVLVV